MNNRQRFLPIVAATMAGMLVLKWEWILGLAGILPTIERSGALTVEYWVGLGVVFLLGFAFPTHRFGTGAWFMWGPTIVTHLVFIAKHGIPNLWPVELAFIVVLTVPYIAASYIGAFVRRRRSNTLTVPS